MNYGGDDTTAGTDEHNRRIEVCANCGEPIRAAFVADDGYVIWDHPTHENHTVCEWYEDMPNTSRVATPTGR